MAKLRSVFSLSVRRPRTDVISFFPRHHRIFRIRLVFLQHEYFFVTSNQSYKPLLRRRLDLHLQLQPGRVELLLLRIVLSVHGSFFLGHGHEDEEADKSHEEHPTDHRSHDVGEALTVLVADLGNGIPDGRSSDLKAAKSLLLATSEENAGNSHRLDVKSNVHQEQVTS